MVESTDASYVRINTAGKSESDVVWFSGSTDKVAFEGIQLILYHEVLVHNSADKQSARRPAVPLTESCMRRVADGVNKSRLALTVGYPHIDASNLDRCWPR